MPIRPSVLVPLLLLPTAFSQGTLVVLDEVVLRPSPAGARDQFGASLALSPGHLAVGAPQRGVQVSQSGQGYVVVYESGLGGWVEETRLLASDGIQGDRFGEALALEGDTLLVGAPGQDPCGPGCGDAGAVYVFERLAGQWVETAKLVRSAGFVLDEFGASLALEGDTALVGAPGADGYVVRLERSGGVWGEVEDLIQSGGTDFSQLYGSAVDLHGGRGLVGAPGFDLASYDSGVGFVWEAASPSWGETARLDPSVAATLTYFGRSVALGEDVAVLGGHSPFTSGPGTAQVFGESGGAWSEVAPLVGNDSVDGDDFGAALTLRGELLAVGAPGRLGETGAVYLFSTGAGWPQVGRLEGAQAASGYGSSLALEAGLVGVGAPGDDVAGLDTGAVHLVTVATPFENYCVSTPNSSTGAALMAGSGSTGVTANDLVLRAEPVPTSQPGLFYYGSDEVLVPFGNGFRCVGAGGGALYRLSVVVAAGNLLSHAVDLTAPPLASGQILPGSTWRFQAWFRDPLAGGSAFDLSDGLRVQFVP